MRILGLIVGFLVVFQVSFSKNIDHITVITLPKSGSLCLIKYLKLLDRLGYPGYSRVSTWHPEPLYYGLKNGHFSRIEKKIILVRDLRDMFISAVHYVSAGNHFVTSYPVLGDKWPALSLDQKVLELSNYREQPQHIGYRYKRMHFPQHYKRQIELAQKLYFQEGSLGVRYEDLSGCLGKKVQFETMKRINDYLEIEVSEEHYAYLMENLWGNKEIKSPTFRVGGMNKWKKQLSQQTQKILWHLYGSYLTSFGYKQ